METDIWHREIRVLVWVPLFNLTCAFSAHIPRHIIHTQAVARVIVPKALPLG